MALDVRDLAEKHAYEMAQRKAKVAAAAKR
jgi:hypothetical protein